jgi:hypothetical protein
VYSTPISDIENLKGRIRAALTVETEEMLEQTWAEIE